MNRHEMQAITAAAPAKTRRYVYDIIPGLAQVDGKLRKQYQVLCWVIDSEGSNAWQAIETELARYTMKVCGTRTEAETLLANLRSQGSRIVGYCVKGGGADVCARPECPEPMGQYARVTYREALRDMQEGHEFVCENCGRPFVEVEDDDQD